MYIKNLDICDNPTIIFFKSNKSCNFFCIIDILQFWTVIEERLKFYIIKIAIWLLGKLLKLYNNGINTAYTKGALMYLVMDSLYRVKIRWSVDSFIALCYTMWINHRCSVSAARIISLLQWSNLLPYFIFNTKNREFEF